jgi:hypothetical protein
LNSPLSVLLTTVPVANAQGISGGVKPVRCMLLPTPTGRELMG